MHIPRCMFPVHSIINPWMLLYAVCPMRLLFLMFRFRPRPPILCRGTTWVSYFLFLFIASNLRAGASGRELNTTCSFYSWLG
jgi:hypothetical protein